MYNAKAYDALFLQTLLHLIQEKCSACRISNYLSVCFTLIGQWVSLGIALQVLHSLKSQDFLSPFALSGLLRQPVLYSLPTSSHHSTLFSFGFQFSSPVTPTPIACSFMLSTSSRTESLSVCLDAASDLRDQLQRQVQGGSCHCFCGSGGDCSDKTLIEYFFFFFYGKGKIISLALFIEDNKLFWLTFPSQGSYPEKTLDLRHS